MPTSPKNFNNSLSDNNPIPRKAYRATCIFAAENAVACVRVDSASVSLVLFLVISVSSKSLHHTRVIGSEGIGC
jgi:hypothetical protein